MRGDCSRRRGSGGCPDVLCRLNRRFVHFYKGPLCISTPSSVVVVATYDVYEITYAEASFTGFLSRIFGADELIVLNMRPASRLDVALRVSGVLWDERQKTLSQ